MRAEVAFLVDKSAYGANRSGRAVARLRTARASSMPRRMRLIAFPLAFIQPGIGFRPTMLTPATRAEGVSDNKWQTPEVVIFALDSLKSRCLSQDTGS